MRLSKFIILLFLLFFSNCTSKSKFSARNKAEQSKNALMIESLDSLDTDTSSSITKNLPYPVQQKIYSINDSLIDYINHSYIDFKNQDSAFSFLKLKELMFKNGFKIDSSIDENDTSEKKTILWKRQFNEREQIEYSKYKNYKKMLIVSELWTDGKKYLSLWIMLLPEKKTMP
jgi:hypothetical protein